MSSYQKQPTVKSLALAMQRRALDEVQKRGTALPGHVVAVDGPFVTVNFDVQNANLGKLTLPLPWPEYIRLPIQVGDKGFAFPVGIPLGVATGEGGAANAMTLHGNLATLVWFPVANKNWTAPPGADANTLALYGKTALELLDSIAGNSSLKLTSTGISLTFGSHTIVIDLAGVHIDGKLFLPHTHNDPQGGITGGVN